MDLNQQQTPPLSVQPLEWTWIVQRHETDGDAASIWKFGFIAPDGADVRVTFHQVGETPGPASAPASDPMAGGPASPTAFAPAGQPSPDRDNTNDATFYVTLFSNRSPHAFLKWDTSLMHNDSLTVWVTITHGIIDFMRKAQPANVILDDLANGKMKMVMRSVAMDIVASNPEYEIEMTQKHHYRTFFQVKRAGSVSAFLNKPGMQDVDPNQPGVDSPSNDPTQQPLAATPTPAQQQATGDKTGDSTITADQQADPAQFPSADPVPIKVTPPHIKGLTVEIGQTDYSVSVKDQAGNTIDRYRASSPADILRWINVKGYGSSLMRIVAKEPSSTPLKAKTMAISPMADTQEQFVVTGNVVRMNVIPAKHAAIMNEIVNAVKVKCTANAVHFVFETNLDMNFKRALVELAYASLQRDTLDKNSCSHGV